MTNLVYAERCHPLPIMRSLVGKGQRATRFKIARRDGTLSIVFQRRVESRGTRTWFAGVSVRITAVGIVRQQDFVR